MIWVAKYDAPTEGEAHGRMVPNGETERGQPKDVLVDGRTEDS
jgi:hypothetical protein